MKITASEYTIQTEQNTITGTGNIVGGTKNTVSGNNNFVIGGSAGIGNNVSGGGNVVCGDGQTIVGNQNVVLGSYQQCSGTGCVVSGSQNTNTSSNMFMAGYLSGFTGGNYIVGVGVNIGGSGSYILCAGNQVGGNGQYILNVGSINVASGSYNFALGTNHYLTVDTTMAFGDQAKPLNKGSFTQAYGKFTNVGDAQTSVMVVRKQTTDDTANVELALDGGTTYITTEDNKAYMLKLFLIAKVSGSTDYAMCEMTGIVVRGAGVATITAPYENFLENSGSGVFAGYDPTGLLGVDTSDGHIKLQVTGIAATTVNWVARVEMTEVSV